MWNFPSTKPAKTQDVEDIMMEIKMGTRQINHQAKNSEKECAKSMKSAKDQLRHNNE